MDLENSLRNGLTHGCINTIVDMPLKDLTDVPNSATQTDFVNAKKSEGNQNPIS